MASLTPALAAWVSRLDAELTSAADMQGYAALVQTRGFDWMHAFVDSVVQDETIYEIAKTPARHKSPKKTHARAIALAASAAKIQELNDKTQNLFEDKENDVVMASPTRGTARKVQRALKFAQENDSDEENMISLPAIKAVKVGTPLTTSKQKPTRVPERERTPLQAKKPSGIRSPSPSKPDSRSREMSGKTPDTKNTKTFTPSIRFLRNPTPVTSPQRSPLLDSEENVFIVAEEPEKRRSPLSVLEDRPQEAPATTRSDWKPEVPLHTIRIPVPPPSPELSAETPGADSDGEGLINSSFRSIPLGSPIRAVPTDPSTAAIVETEAKEVEAQLRRLQGSTTPSSEPPPRPASQASGTVPSPVPVAPIDGTVVAQGCVDVEASPVWHQDMQVSLNDEKPSSDGGRQSWFHRASSASRVSTAATRKSTFTRSFAPRARIFGSTAAVPDPTSGALIDSNPFDEQASIPPVPTRVTGPAFVERTTSSLMHGIKRKSSTTDAQGEHSSKKSKTLQQETTENVYSQVHVHTHAQVPLIPQSTISPGDAGLGLGIGDKTSMSSLAQLAAVVRGMNSEPPIRVAARVSIDPSSPPRDVVSAAPNTRTFDMRELLGEEFDEPIVVPGEDDDDDVSSGLSESEKDPSVKGSFEIPSNAPTFVVGDDQGPISDDEEDDSMATDDMAVVFDPQASYTPPNSPPATTATRLDYSIPDATAPSAHISRPLQTEKVQPIPSAPHSTEARTNSLTSSGSGSSILSVARSAFSNLFKPSIAAQIKPTPPPQAPLNIFTPDSPVKTASFPRNPFLPASPEKPLPNSPPRQPIMGTAPVQISSQQPVAQNTNRVQLTQQSTQSTILSSQATVSSLFDSQAAYGARRSFEGDMYDTDVTEPLSVFAESQPGEGKASFVVDELVTLADAVEKKDAKEVATALTAAEADSNVADGSFRGISVEREDGSESVPVNPKSQMPISVAKASRNHMVTATTNLRPAEAEKPPITKKIIKAMPSMMSLAAKRKEDAAKTIAKTQSFERMVPAPSVNKKLDSENRKRERGDDGTAKVSSAPVSKSNKQLPAKLDESVNTTKKRKVDTENKPNVGAEKLKPIGKPLPSMKSNLGSSNIASTSKAPFRPPPFLKVGGGFKPTSSTSTSSRAPLPTKTSAVPSIASLSRPTSQSQQPNAQVQARMAATLEAQIAVEKSKQKQVEFTEPEIVDEDIDLPDIASEYSNSSDEDRPKKELADWAEPDQLMPQLVAQADLDPDEIFGAIGEPNLELFFGAKYSKSHSRFRVRSSSANWNAGDGLTPQESLEYARRMGYRGD